MSGAWYVVGLAAAVAVAVTATLVYLRRRAPAPTAGELARQAEDRERQRLAVEKARKGPRGPLEGL